MKGKLHTKTLNFSLYFFVSDIIYTISHQNRVSYGAQL